MIGLIAGICMCFPVGGDYKPAERLDPVVTTPVWPVGIWNQPYAPFGLSDCEEMLFYARQFGLPDSFSTRIGWRESNCRNEDGVHTSCCWGYFQLHEMHFRNHPEIYGRICGAYSYQDVNSDNPLDKQRQACSAKQLYDAVGMSAWG